MRNAILLSIPIFVSSCCLAWPPGPSVTPNKVEDGSNSPIAKMRSHINLTVVDKGFMKRDVEARDYQDKITFICVYKNVGKKDIRAFEGRVMFTDLFDKIVSGINLTISDPIKAGNQQEYTCGIEYNRFKEDHRRLESTDLKDLKVQWIPSAIIFMDGTKIGIE